MHNMWVCAPVCKKSSAESVCNNGHYFHLLIILLSSPLNYYSNKFMTIEIIANNIDIQ